MLPVIVKKSMTPVDTLDSLASSAEPFSQVQLSENLTVNIISSVVMNRDFGALIKITQTNSRPLATSYSILLERAYESPLVLHTMSGVEAPLARHNLNMLRPVVQRPSTTAELTSLSRGAFSP